MIQNATPTGTLGYDTGNDMIKEKAPTNAFMDGLGKATDLGGALNSAANSQGLGKAAGLMGLVKGVMSLFAGSDERLKRGVEHESPGPRENDELTNLLDKIRPVAFDYKNPDAFGHGRHVGVLAQDVEKSSVGESLVADTPHGKMLKVPAVASAALSASADLHHRLKKVEHELSRLGRK